MILTPGADVAREIRVRNTGDVVDRFELDILGDAAAWTTVSPASINLLPGQESTAELRFAPPRTAKVTAGATPFALRVMSLEDTAGSVVSEASVTVAPFTTVAAELLPRTSRGSRVGRHQLAVDNLGNHPADIRILAADPDEILDFRIQPDTLTAAPGTATFVKIHAIPRKRFLKGPDKTLPFEVSVLAPDAEPVIVSGSMLQQPLVPPWLLKAVLIATAALLALFVLWQAVLKPTVSSTAREVAEEETAPLEDAVTTSQETADDAAASAEEARIAAGLAPKPKGAAGAAGGTAGSAGAGGPVGAGGSAGREATDFRIAANAPPGPLVPFTFTPPKDKLVWVSDIVLQNPRGDSGILTIRRGDTVLLEFGLENFRDVDYHLIQPARFSREEPVVIGVECRNPGGAACTPSVYFTGYTQDAPKAGG